MGQRQVHFETYIVGFGACIRGHRSNPQGAARCAAQSLQLKALDQGQWLAGKTQADQRRYPVEPATLAQRASIPRLVLIMGTKNGLGAGIIGRRSTPMAAGFAGIRSPAWLALLPAGGGLCCPRRSIV